MSKCIGCEYYDESVDCCNADENCYQQGVADTFDKVYAHMLNDDWDTFLEWVEDNLRE